MSRLLNLRRFVGGRGDFSTLNMFTGTLASLRRCQSRAYEVVSLFGFCLVCFAVLCASVELLFYSIEDNLLFVKLGKVTVISFVSSLLNDWYETSQLKKIITFRSGKGNVWRHSHLRKDYSLPFTSYVSATSSVYFLTETRIYDGCGTPQLMCI